jgi:dethiobiotin synthetase
LHVPTTPNTLVIEGAGGLLVPLNERELYIDAVQAWQVPVVLVVRLYLGCINHSLLSLEALRTRNLPLLGVVFNGEPQPEVEAAILGFSGAHYIGHLPHLPQPDFASLQAVFRSWAWPLAQE